MSDKTVTLSNNAYGALAGRKRPGESLSDVVLRLAGADLSPLEFAGAWSSYPKSAADAFDEWIRWSKRICVERPRRAVDWRRSSRPRRRAPQTLP